MEISHNETMKFKLFSGTTCTLFLIVLISTNLALAEKIKVKKVKGNSAVVETDFPLEEGQTYELANEPLSGNVDYKVSSLKVRQNSLSFGSSFEYVKSDLSQNSEFNLQVRYGWNFSNIEIGVSALASSVDQGAGGTTSILAGGYFDYNLVNNRDPNSFIYGGFVLLATGSTQYPSSQTGGSSSKIESNVGGFLTYFLGGTNTAVRAEAFYNYQQINTTSQQNTVAGFGARGLLVFYF